ncbi:ATP-binding protein [Cellulophaga sp. HaHaR_3_176]|uniref:AAA family ATPase n=1 Tax=Cellulophaga sp. HaHaR_3_176 TaxID=1942464 RepID=UPI001C1FC62D|nr:ATP-binding protein [Cellulophaga sp. HaHaR_3_176]QWX82515.1 ATP-binding protein [Cellulophaga sp. HaHaR_3_176]
MIHLIVGNTGSGKTTYSNQLKEKTKGVIFSIDTWNAVLFLPDKSKNDGITWFLERIERSETLIQKLILQLKHSNVDAILDLGLSKITHRAKFIAFANQHKVEYQIHYLNISKEIRRERILKRNTEQGDTFEFEVTDENFEFMETWFEKLTKKELKNALVIEE